MVLAGGHHGSIWPPLHLEWAVKLREKHAEARWADLILAGFKVLDIISADHETSCKLLSPYEALHMLAARKSAELVTCSLECQQRCRAEVRPADVPKKVWLAN